MKNRSVNIAGKLPKGLVDLYREVDTHTRRLGIEYLVVGAMARDLVLVYGYGSTIERGTRDVDFGINVASWEDFNTLRRRLLEVGYHPDPKKIYKLTYEDGEGLPWEIDILPFGGIADKDANISWPPNQEFVMNTLGFAEAAEYALQVKIGTDPDIIIPVASPAGVCILKLVAWLDREQELKKKDAADFGYLIQSYTKIPEIFDAVYDDGYMEAQDWGEAKASAMKLGRDAGAIALPATKAFLGEALFGKPISKEQFARDMQGQNKRDFAQCKELLDIFSDAFLSAG